MVEQRFVAGVVGSALIRIASGFHVEAHRKALQMHDFINRIHDLEVFRTDFGNRQVQEVNHLIFPALLCLTALLYLAERKINTKNLFFAWSLFNVRPISRWCPW